MIGMKMIMWLWVMLVLAGECYGCLEQERIALLQIKAYINGSSLPTWEDALVGEETIDCCKWERVKCNAATGRVIQLSLNFTRNYFDQGYWYLNASMFLPFEELETLDLTANSIVGGLENEGFEKLAMLSNLENLDLSYNYFNNSILSTLGGLTSLKSLTLHGNRLNGTFYVDDLKGLKNLKELDVSQNELDSFITHPGFERVSVLGKIEVLDLGDNQFNSSILSSLGVLSSLKSLNLGSNNLRGSIHISGLKHLEYLSLRGNHLNGSLPGQGWCELHNLQELDISENNFTGMLPLCFGNLTSIRLLDLSFNQFTGNLALSPLTRLTTLEYLLLSHNHFTIPFSFVSFFNHSKLKVLSGDNNSLIDHIDEFERSIPRFQLQVFRLTNCRSNKPGIKLPHFLYYQYDLRLVDLSHNMLGGTLPIWLLENNTRLEFLKLRNNSIIAPFLLSSHPNPHAQSIDISDNHFEGQLPTNIGLIFPNLLVLNMSRNQFEGGIPSSLGGLDSLMWLDLSHNNLSGQIPEHLPTGLSSLLSLDLSHNNLSGQISPSFSNLTELRDLVLDNNLLVGRFPSNLSTLSNLFTMDISNNYLSGKLPRLSRNMSSLAYVVMFSNHFEGPIPTEFCKLRSLYSLDLSKNHLSGSMPTCLYSSRIRHVRLNQNRLRGPLSLEFFNRSSLVTFDLSNNNLVGKIPSWIGSLPALSILLLKFNNFEGEIPLQICQLKQLNILDLSQNSFSGPIPSCFYNISSEKDAKSYNPGFMWANIVQYTPDEFVKSNLWRPRLSNDGYPTSYMLQEAMLTTKWMSYSYKGNILNHMSGVDLSCNLLTGEIPHGIGNMNDIHALNLSHNNLTGSIPATFSGLREVESLDLSYNSLSGSIPPQLIELGNLAVFSVAHNNLSGTTPERKAQFGTFEESSYEGNPLLCGPPLHNSCTGNVPTSTIQVDMDGDIEDGGFLDMQAFYVSFVVSYIIMLLAIVAVLFINPDWRLAWFRLIEICITSCYYFVVDSFTRLVKGRRV